MALLFCAGSEAAEPVLQGTDLIDLSLEELMEIEITSVSKKPERVADAAAAVFVITAEDIRRSGATNIPDLLRMVPGVHVGRIDANRWTVSARGFGQQYANKLLVLMDGRVLYTPLFSGTYWDVQNPLLEDIERIEVIRGPGATLWGANAVNGVINIITKQTEKTQGTLVSAGAGSRERAFGSLRQGGQIGESLFFKVYGSYRNREIETDVVSTEINSATDMVQAGFRADWLPSGGPASFTLLGEIYRGGVKGVVTGAKMTPPFSEVLRDETDLTGGFVLGRWEQDLPGSSLLTAQLYYDRSERDYYFTREIRDTVDLDIQWRTPLGSRQELMVGGRYRFTRDAIRNSLDFSFTPDRRADHLVSAFVQDEITLVQDHLRLIVGTKVEHNDYTGFEIQPNGRLIWTPHPWQTLWGAVSRAVHTPSRVDHDVTILFGNFPILVVGDEPLLLAQANLVGDPRVDSEELIAYELGYRVQPVEWFSLDVALFYNRYENLRTFELELEEIALEPKDGAWVIDTPMIYDNKMDGETYGVEVVVQWRPIDAWRLQGAYTAMQIELEPDEDGLDFISAGGEGLTPYHQVSLRSFANLPWNLELDLWGRYVDELPSIGVDSYLTLDVRLGWRPLENLELSLVGRDLLEDRHPEQLSEMNSMNPEPVEIERSVYGKITWTF